MQRFGGVGTATGSESVVFSLHRSFMANPAFRPDSEGRTLKDNDIIQ